MDTPFDNVLKLTNDITNLTTQTSQVLKKVIDLEEKVTVQQGSIEICLGFISSKYGKDEFMDFLNFVSGSKHHSKEAKLASSAMIQQENLWGKLLKDGKAQ
jgi:hypothetical protein